MIVHVRLRPAASGGQQQQQQEELPSYIRLPSLYTLSSLLLASLVIVEAWTAATADSLVDSRDSSKNWSKPSLLAPAKLAGDLGGDLQRPVTPVEPIGVAPPIFRQVRATTRKQHLSATEPAEVTTTTTTATGVPEDAAEQDADNKRPASSSSSSRRRKKAKQAAAAARRQEEDEDEEEEPTSEEAERARQRERKRQRHRNRNSTLSAATTGEPPSSTPTSTTTTTTTVASTPASSTSAPARLAAGGLSGSAAAPANGSATAAGHHSSSSSSSRPHSSRGSTSSSTQAPPGGGKRPSSLALDHEYFDDDDDDSPLTSPKSARKSGAAPDLGKIKLVGLSQFNETSAGAGLPANLSSLPAAPVAGGLAPLGDEPLDSLDPRSPGLAKRLASGILSSNGPRPSPRPATSTTVASPAPTPATWSSSSPKFAYSKPYSTTTMMTPASSEAPQPHLPAWSAQPMPADLDWSKLVKVVFRGARDNQTLHTVVVNSSELSNQPISDWSQEMPHLLERDFEALIQKWAHVFPQELLMSDLGRLLLGKTASANLTLNATPTGSPNQTSVSTPPAVLAPAVAASLPPPPLVQPALLPAAVQNASTGWRSEQPVQPVPPLQPISSTTTTTSTTTSTSGPPVAQFSPLPAATSAAPLPAATNQSTWSHTLPGQLVGNTSMTWSSPRPLPITPDLFNFTTPWSSTLGGGVSTAGTPEPPPAAKSPPPETPAARPSSRDKDEPDRYQADVREQTEALRHFIVMCSVAVVVATSLVVAFIVLLFKK